MNLYDASRQWAERPADQRFSSLSEMLTACRSYYERACQSTVPFNTLRAVTDKDGEEVQVEGRSGISARLSFWAFGQLSSLAGAPASYLRRLPADLAAGCLNHGLELNGSPAPLELLFHQTMDENGQLPLPNTASVSNNPLLLRALTSDKYTRIWNWEVVERVKQMAEDGGWRVPPARPAFYGQPGARRANEEDVLNAKGFLSIEVGDWIAPAGLYASAHDMFVFLVNEQRRIDDGTDEGLSRGVFFENSEVGGKSLRCTTFLYRHVCGNHIVWGASNVINLKIRHIGKARERFSSFVLNLQKYADAAASRDESKIKKAQSSSIGATKEETLNRLFRSLNQQIPLEQLGEAFDLAEEYHHIDGDPHTPWGMAQGITRLSQKTPFADERARLDRGAGKVLQISF